MPTCRSLLVIGWPALAALALALGVGGSTAKEPPVPPLTEVASDPPVAVDPHDDAAGHRGPACLVVERFFADEVWAKVGETTCLKCHRAGGDAEESKFVLLETTGTAEQRAVSLFRNRAAFQRMATVDEEGEPRLLVKATGGLDHGGGQVLKEGSTGLGILERYVARLKSTSTDPADPAIADARPFFEGVEMLPPQRLLRRVTLSLAGRLPNDGERAAVEANGAAAVDEILPQVMQEQAFYDRLKEAFNDILLTRGLDDVPERVLSYDHFNETRGWPQKHDLGDLPEKEKTQARYALFRVYREALLREPLELIEFIVRHDRPFTELVTADYIMVSPHTARGYGIFEAIRDRFDDPEDPYEYVPHRLAALKGRNGKVQESPTGFYPHAGLLSTFHWVRRYPTTDTNRNRLRARMYYQHFLGIDVMQLAPRVTDAAAVDAQYEIPTMQAAECVVCHRTVDPVAGLFRDYDMEGAFAARAWYDDMFPPGLDEEPLPEGDRWRALQWLGERTARDPRFAVAMVEHVYYVLHGRKVLSPPADIDDPLFTARRRAYLVQRQMVEEVAAAFVADDFNLKSAFTAMIGSDFYRADGLATVAATAALSPERRAELDDVGVARLLTPEQLERKILALFGRRWGRLDKGDAQLDILYGGIDSQEITERIADPSGAMGAIQRIMANEVACRHVPLDFGREPSDRRLFPRIEPDVLPADGPEAEQRIREAIVHLHRHVLGLEQTADDPDVDRTYALFADIVAEAAATKGLSQEESYFCRASENKPLPDPHYTLRAWRAVVTYLLRRPEFLYE